MRRPRAATNPNSARFPRSALIVWVRWRTKRSRVRNSIAPAWLASVLTATNRMVGRLAASLIASASATSFFCRFTYGLTKIGAISRTACPSLAASRPQWCAVPQASIATMQVGWLARNGRSCARETFLRNTTVPSAAAPCSWNTRFARSMPMMLTSFMDALSFSGDWNFTSLAHRDAVGMGASTPSLHDAVAPTSSVAVPEPGIRPRRGQRRDRGRPRSGRPGGGRPLPGLGARAGRVNRRAYFRSVV